MVRSKDSRRELWVLWVLVFLIELGWVFAFHALGVTASAFGAEFAEDASDPIVQKAVQPAVRPIVQDEEADAAADELSEEPVEEPVEGLEDELLDEPMSDAIDASPADAGMEVAATSTALEDPAVPGGTQVSLEGDPSAGPVGEAIDGEAVASEEAKIHRTFLSYFAVFYGPGIQDPGPYQPKVGGGSDRNRPVQLRNFLNLGYQLSQPVAVSGTAVWAYQPGLSDKFVIQDPFVRVSHNSLVNSENFNWYGDFRVHFGISDLSRKSDLLTSFQTFHALTWVPGSGTFAASLYGSARYNLFGKQGDGSDVELYLAPYLQYDVSQKVALTLMYEIGASHIYGTKNGKLVSDGADFEPGVLWQITPNLAVNPYLNLYPDDGFALDTASFGMTLGWKLL